MTTCLNCGRPVNGKYCPFCGQKTEVERFTPSVALAEIVHFFTHFEKGFLHTAWGFIARPGFTSMNFLQGKRKRYQPPVSYLVICTALYILAHNLIINQYHFHITAKGYVQADIKEKANIFLRTHFTPIIFFILIISSIVIYFILGRPKFNFTEIFIISLYGGGTYLLILFFSDAILGFIFKVNIISQKVFLWQTILSSLYNFWFCFSFFSKVKQRYFWPRLFTVAILIAVIGLTLFTYLPLLWLYLFRA